jgi:hypothetical protein
VPPKDNPDALAPGNRARNVKRGAELVVRLAERRFQHHYEPTARRQRRVAQSEQF